jgi:hypothetical protein
MKECTDQELIEKLKSGENPALNELLARYKHRLFAFIRRYVGIVVGIISFTTNGHFSKAH